MMHLVEKIDGSILWRNLHLLFWLSLLPFPTCWMGENPFDHPTLFLYGTKLLCFALAHFSLQRRSIRLQGAKSVRAHAIVPHIKGKDSAALYLLAIGTRSE